MQTKCPWSVITVKSLKHKIHQLKYDTVPMIDVQHFFVEYLFILENEVWQFQI
jgi:hypothetical protein